MRQFVIPAVAVDFPSTAAIILKLAAPYLADLLSRSNAHPHRGLAAAHRVRHRADRYPSSPGRPPRHADYAPGGIFDPLFAGLSADAARVHAAIKQTERGRSLGL